MIETSNLSPAEKEAIAEAFWRHFWGAQYAEKAAEKVHCSWRHMTPAEQADSADRYAHGLTPEERRECGLESLPADEWAGAIDAWRTRTALRKALPANFVTPKMLEERTNVIVRAVGRAVRELLRDQLHDLRCSMVEVSDGDLAELRTELRAEFRAAT